MIQNELSSLRSEYSHRGFIKLHEVYDNRYRTIIVLEFAEGGSIAEHIL